MKSIYGNAVLLTGASSGIGQATARLLSKEGFHVYGTSRKKELPPLLLGESGGFLKMIHTDITNEESVIEAVGLVIEAEGRIDIVVNCAGAGIAGSIEDTSIQEAMEQFDTNFFGVMRICRNVLPYMRKQGKGLIINIGSVAEFIPIPYQAMYSASKYALESYTQALRMEVAPFGIRASIVAPGDTKTNFTASRRYNAQAVTNPVYREHFKRALYSMVASELKGKDPATVAQVVRKIIYKEKPPIRTVVCLDYKLVAFAKRLLPAKWLEAALKKMYIGAKIPKNPIWSFEKEVLGEDK